MKIFEMVFIPPNSNVYIFAAIVFMVGLFGYGSSLVLDKLLEQRIRLDNVTAKHCRDKGYKFYTRNGNHAVCHNSRVRFTYDEG